jgi:hypothetical protein
MTKAPRKRRKSVTRRAGRAAARGGGLAARKVWDEKHTIAALASAAAIGAIQGKGIDLPHIKQIGMAGTYGIGAWLAGRFLKSKTLSHVATGLLSVGAYEAVFTWLAKKRLEEAAAKKKTSGFESDITDDTFEQEGPVIEGTVG